MTLIAYRGRCPRCGREEQPFESTLGCKVEQPITDPAVIEATFAADFEAEEAPRVDRTEGFVQ